MKQPTYVDSFFGVVLFPRDGGYGLLETWLLLQGDQPLGSVTGSSFELELFRQQTAGA